MGDDSEAAAFLGEASHGRVLVVGEAGVSPASPTTALGKSILTQKPTYKKRAF
ncbi:MAG: hypothetical protein KME09_00120 [Pleurocapsa minor HA4230-MV1]|nr:hypothetical protein [Pleurocapsa minor HA4230-MV1]